MKKLAVLQSAPLVEALMRRLEEASIEAFSTTERSVTAATWAKRSLSEI